LNQQTRRALAIGVSATLAAYALGGFLLAPLVVAKRVTHALAQQTGREVGIGRVRVNPFTLTTTLDDVTLGQPGDTAVAGVRRITARHHFTDVFARGWRASKVTFTAPQLTLPAGLDWSNSWPARFAAVADLDVDDVTVEEGVLQVHSSGPASLRFGALSMSLRGLASAPGRVAHFTLSAAEDDGGGLTAAGSIAPSLAQLDADVTLEGIDLGKFKFSLGPAADFVLSSGVLGAQVEVIRRGDNTTIVGDANLERVAVVDAASAAVVINAAAVSAESLTLRPAPVAISAGVLRVLEPRLRMGRVADGTAFGGAWLGLFAPRLPGASVASERIEIVDGSMEWTDATTTPPVYVQATNVNGSIVQKDPLAPATASLAGSLMPGMTTRLGADWEPAASARAGAWQLRIEQLDATLLSPYLRAVANHDIGSGAVNLTLERKMINAADAYDCEIVASNMRLLRREQRDGSVAWPLGFAQALLEDVNGDSRIAVAVPSQQAGQNRRLTARLRDALADYVSGITLTPFAHLARLAGVPGENLAQIEFASGSASLTPAASARLGRVATALSQRPAVRITATGHFDPVADRDALARQQMRLHVALASGVGDRARAAESRVDFTDPKVISIIEEFAGERLRAVAVTAIAARFPQGGPDYYDALYEALVGNETVSRRALNNLARFRARTVVGQLVAAGIAQERLAVSRAVEPVAQKDDAVFVRLRVEGEWTGYPAL